MPLCQEVLILIVIVIDCPGKDYDYDYDYDYEGYFNNHNLANDSKYQQIRWTSASTN
jgi:hypothetical protein